MPSLDYALRLGFGKAAPSQEEPERPEEGVEMSRAEFEEMRQEKGRGYFSREW